MGSNQLYNFLRRSRNALRLLRHLIGPRDFAWKVRRRMRLDRNSLFVTFVDKYLIKDYCAKLGIKTAPLLFATKQPAEIPFDELPDNYFIKANHASGWNLICLHKQLYRFGSGEELLGENGSFQEANSPLRISREECIALCTKWVNTKYTQIEWAYNCVEPYIIVEEVLDVPKIEELFDYRLYTFNGIVKCIAFGSPVYRKKGLNAFFDAEWKPFPLSAYCELLPDPLPLKPARFDEMKTIAERVGKGIDFLRIDLYDTNQGVMLGEVTVYPDAGEFNTPTDCRTFNAWLGKQWKQSLKRS